MPTKTWRRSSRPFMLLAAITVVLATLGAGVAATPAKQFPAFIPMPGVTPEGVAVDRTGNVFVSVREGPRGVILQFSRSGEASRFADVGTATITGMAFAPSGDLYVAMAAGPDQGVYRVHRNGVADLLPGTSQIVYANGLAFDRGGTLYVTESYSMDSPPQYGPGGIWRISRGEETELWLRDPLLTGIGAVLGYPVGANGIGFHHGDLYVVNTDKGLVVRVPVRLDGNAGPPEAWTTLQEVPGSPLGGSPFPIMGDGLALDEHGNLYVAVISRNAVVRIDAGDRSQDTVALLTPLPSYPTAPFDTPASLAFGTSAGGRESLFVTNLGWMANIIPGPAWPGPALVSVDANHRAERHR